MQFILFRKSTNRLRLEYAKRLDIMYDETVQE